MDFFTRKRPCLLIETQHTIENTKKLLINKLNFLKSQYKFCFESLHRNENLSTEFVQSMLFSFDFASKIIDAISHLIVSSEAGWELLKTYFLGNNFPYILGDFKKNVSILDTSAIYQESDFFFFVFLKFGIIDFRTWRNLCMLKNYSDNFGLLSVSDFPYYVCKKESLIDPPPYMKKNLNELDSHQEDFYRFLGRPIEFKAWRPGFWNFLKITESLKNFNSIEVFFKNNSYSYDLMRKDTKKSNITKDQKNALFDGLERINDFEDLYFVLSEFKLFKTPEARKLFGQVLIYFLNQNESFFENAECSLGDKSVEEKLIRSAQWLEMILFLSSDRINISRRLNRKTGQNFRMACELELSALKNEFMFHKMMSVDFPGMKIIIWIWQKLKENSNYSKSYSKYTKDYLSLLEKFN